MISAPQATRRRLLWPVLVVVLVGSVAANLAMGAVSVAPSDVISVLLDHLGIDSGNDVTRQADSVVWSLRLPRLVLALAVGAGLGTAGAVLQGLFRNPLADPQIIGISSGGALGAAIVLAAAPGFLGDFGGSVGGFLGALAIAALVFVLGRYHGRTEVVNLVLTGVALSAVAAAAVGYLSFAIDNPRLQTAVFWFLGSFSLATWDLVRPALLFIGVALVIAPLFARRLDLLLVGESEARHLGVDVERTRAALLVIVSLAVGASVAAAGIIGFVGLLVPHAVRLVAGPLHRTVIPASAVGGAALMALADLGGRTLALPSEIPVGLLTALVGGPFFLWLLRRTRAQYGGWG